MEPRRYLRCLGQPQLFAGNGEPIKFRTKKHLALLVFLAVESGRPHRRDRISEFLWPNARIAEARHSLATALSILRPRVGLGALETTRDCVSLPHGRLALDLDRLLKGDVLGQEITGPLEVNAFLEGFDIADAPEFSLWKDRQRARLLPAIRDALIVLIDRCRRTCDTTEIEQLADRMLALDELNEEAIRAKMEARAFAGDRLTALKLFEAWKGKLAAELSALPSNLLEGMATRLRRRGWERSTLSEIPTVPTDQWRGRSFVGRSGEYQVLYEAWEAAKRGVSEHVLVFGDSGVGKTTLVERLTTAAGLEGAAVSRVQCYDLERDIPYATVGTLIQGLLDRPGASGTPPESLAELARTFPEIRRRFAALPPPADSVGETARIRLSESFRDMLQAIAEEHPLILVVDDLHLADEPSMAVLHLIIRHTRTHPIMLILLARPGELWQSVQASRLRDSAKVLGMRVLEIPPLSEGESRELLRALSAAKVTQPNASACRALLGAAAGFPMVLELLYQDWETNGDRSLALAVDAMTSEFGGTNAPPQLYTEVLHRLVRAMDPGTHGVLNIASILGRRLNDVNLYRIADLSVGQTMAGMAELVSRRVLRDGGEGLEFVNELVRTAAYLGVPSPLRRLLHSNIADHLLKSEQQDEATLGLEIAWHCIRAGRTSEATPHLLRGARDAIRCGAPHSAERALTSVLPSLIGDDRVEASLLLAEVLQEEGRPVESLDVLSTLREAAQGHLRYRMIALTALADRSRGVTNAADLEDQAALLGEAVRLCPDPAARVLAARALAYLLLESRNRQLTQEALELLDLIPCTDLDVDSLGQLALARAVLLYQLGNPSGSFVQATLAIEELKRRGAANLLTVQLQGGIGSIRSGEGRYEEAIECYQQALTMAVRLGNDKQIASIRGNVALCFGRIGSYAEQLEWASKASEAGGAEFVGFREIQATYCQGFAHAMRGRGDLALELVATFDTRMVDPISPWMQQAWSLWKADLLLLCDRRVEAFAVAKASLLNHSYELRTVAFAGPYARWLSLSADTLEEKLAAKARLTAMAEQLDRYDALDQAEILCALDLQERSGGNSSAQVKERLDRLPSAVRIHLVKLGFSMANHSS